MTGMASSFTHQGSAVEYQSPIQRVVQATGQNLSAYYCPTPEERVYVSLAGDVFNPAVLSVSTGAFVIWSSYGNPLPQQTHSITTNATANGSLPTFNFNLPPQDQVGYTFSVPGTYYYYDIYYPSNKGEITVHARTSVGSAVLGVNMNPGTPNILFNKIEVNGSSFSASVVAINATNLSSWEICLQYDTSVVQETAFSLAPEWDAARNPNALGGASIYTGDGVIRADSYIISGTPGVNATGLETLFSVSFNAINYGPGNLQLTGYLTDSNGYNIDYTRQNGYYLIVPIAGLIYEATYTGQPFAGAMITVQNTFANFGQSTDRVTDAEIVTDFGTFHQTIGLPLNLTSFTNTTLTMPMSIPTSASPGQHPATLVADWQYLRLNQTSGASTWITAPQLTFSGSITIQSIQPQNPSKPPKTGIPTISQIPSGVLTLAVQLLSALTITNWRLFLVGVAGTWASLVATAFGLLYHHSRKSRKDYRILS